MGGLEIGNSFKTLIFLLMCTTHVGATSRCHDVLASIGLALRGQALGDVIQERDRLTLTLRAWERWGGFPLSDVEVRRNMVVGRLHYQLRANRHWVTTNDLEPLVREIYLNYHVILRSERAVTALNQLVRAERETSGSLDRDTLLRHIETWLIEIRALRSQLQSSRNSVQTVAPIENALIALRSVLDKDNNSPAILTAVQNVMEVFLQDIQSRANQLASRYEEFSAAMGTLEAFAANVDAPGIKAKKILENLQAQRLLQSYFLVVGGEPTTPERALIHQCIDRHPQAYVNDLRQRLRRQRFASILTWFPTTIIITRLDQLATWSGVIANYAPVHSFLNYLQDPMTRFRHTSAVVEVMNVRGTPEQRLQTLEQNNTLFPSDELLVTFRRLIDFEARTAWNQMLTAAAARPDTGFHARMLAAETQAAREGELPPIWQTGYGNRIIRMGMDALAISLIGWYVSGRPSLWSQPASSDNSQDDDAVKNLLDKVEHVLELAEDDPQAQRLFAQAAAARRR